MSNEQSALVTLGQISVAGAFDRYQDQIIAAMDTKVMDPVRFMRIGLTVIRRNPDLNHCTLASILGALVQSAQMGLYPDDLRGLVFLAPFWNSKTLANGEKVRVFEAELMVGYQGWIELFRNSGMAANNAVEGRVVWEKDLFDYEFGMKAGRKSDWYMHKPSSSQDPGEMKFCYSLLNYLDGTSAFSAMSKEQAEKHRDAFTKTKGKNGPWWNPMTFPEMAIKTTIRKATKYAPTSPAMREAAALEELGEAGLSQKLDALVEINEKAAMVVVGEEEAGLASTEKRAGSTSKMAEFMGTQKPAPELPKQEAKKETKEEDPPHPATVEGPAGEAVDASTGEILEEKKETPPEEPEEVNQGELTEAEEKQMDKELAEQQQTLPGAEPEPGAKG